MTVQELHYQFKLSKDRVDTLSNQDFNPAEIDWFLNEAQLVYVKRQYDNTFETNERISKALSNLVVKKEEQGDLVPTNLNGVYELPLSLLKYPHLYIISGTAKVMSGTCTSTVVLKPISHDDYLDALRDPFNRSSKEHLLYNYGKSSETAMVTSMYMYPTIPSTVESVQLEYIKYPSRISIGTYTYIDGITYPPTTSELNEQSHVEIVDLAVVIASMNIESPEYIQLKTAKLGLAG